jgi:hypothetical protein
MAPTLAPARVAQARRSGGFAAPTPGDVPRAVADDLRVRVAERAQAGEFEFVADRFKVMPGVCQVADRGPVLGGAARQARDAVVGERRERLPGHGDDGVGNGDASA